MGKLAQRLADASRSGVYRLRDAPGAFARLLATLGAAAAERRAAGLRFFAAFVDPSAKLAVAPLYNRHRKPTEEIHGTDQAESQH